MIKLEYFPLRWSSRQQFVIELCLGTFMLPRSLGAVLSSLC